MRFEKTGLKIVLTEHLRGTVHKTYCAFKWTWWTLKITVYFFIITIIYNYSEKQHSIDLDLNLPGRFNCFILCQKYIYAIILASQSLRFLMCKMRIINYLVRIK